MFCVGKGPFRWVALSGDAEDIARTDAKVKELFPEDRGLQRWLDLASKRIHFQGLPARICWLGLGQRHLAGLAFNEMVRTGELKAPIVIGRDHLDAGSVASPNRETEAMRDGTDAVSDWPLLNLMLNTASARPGCRSTMASAWATRSTPADRLRRHRRRRSASSACCGTTRRAACCATRTPATPKRSPAPPRRAGAAHAAMKIAPGPSISPCAGSRGRPRARARPGVPACAERRFRIGPADRRLRKPAYGSTPAGRLADAHPGRRAWPPADEHRAFARRRHRRCSTTRPCAWSLRSRFPPWRGHGRAAAARRAPARAL